MDDGGGKGPRMKMREAGFVPTVGVLQAFQSGDCAELDSFCSFVRPVGKRLNLESLKVVTLPRQIHYYLLSVS